MREMYLMLLRKQRDVSLFESCYGAQEVHMVKRSICYLLNKITLCVGEETVKEWREYEEKK